MGKLRRNNEVVPQREFVVKADSGGDFLFTGFSYSALRFINLVSNIGYDLETCLGDSIGGMSAGIANRKQRGTAPTTGDLGEESVLDGVELGAVGRVVNHEDFDVELFGEVEEVLIDGAVPAGVGPAAVTEDDNHAGIGIELPEMAVPHTLDVVADKLGRVLAGAYREIDRVVGDVVDALRHNRPLGECLKVVVVNLGEDEQ